MKATPLDTPATPAKQQSFLLWGLLILLVATVVRLLFVSTTMVVDDESYYYVWAHHLAAGYIDGGPTIAYVNKLFVMLLGANSFSVRLGAIVLMTALSVYLFFWGTKRFGERTGFLLFLLVTLTPGCFLASIIHTYDTEMAVCMMAAIALYYDAYFVDARMFYPAGIMLGLALFSKISVLFPAMGIFLLPFVIKPLRGALKKKEFYLSFLLAALVFLPFIYWNMTHGWAFVKFKGGMAYRHGDLNSFVNVWLAQVVLLYLPVLFWYALALPIKTLFRAIRRRDALPDECYFALIAIVPILYFGIGSIFSEYYANWVAPVFFGGIFLTAVCIGRQWPAYRKSTLVQIALSVVLLAVFISQAYFNYLPLGKKADTTNRYYLYSAIPHELKGYLDAHPEYRQLRIVGNGYQIPSLINLYVQPQRESIGLSLGGYHGTMYSMLYPHQTLRGESFLFLQDGSDTFPPEFRRHFATVSWVKTFISRRNGQDINHLSLWYVTGFHDDRQ